ncbi:MAG: sodium-dependent transporter [Acidobacteria bacterium]|nr:sodium-dependent transporter [Acidobacteriota bacterium]MCB9398935.1 sodium-dependent transporter [Acidobacteriota bacterium]
MAVSKAPRFSSKLAMILTCMGMAVGTGNIWRFPREVAKNGGGSFLIPWILALVLWSIPLLMVELGIGKKTRKGPHGAFRAVLGKRWAWMGGFISACAMLIMCYYAVVTGWTFKYLVEALRGTLYGLDADQTHAIYTGMRGSLTALVFHVIAIAVAGHFVFGGARGIERINKVLIPGLILILVFGAIKSLMLAGSGGGIDYLFHVDTERLSQGSHWLAGFTQSAWSTGAGWGLMLAYAVYAREQDDPVTTPVATGFGNNFIEIMVGLMIFPAVFAIMGQEGVNFIATSNGTGGIAFEVTPLLMSKMPGGSTMLILFFIGLASAALTSLIAMVELSTRFFMDYQIERKKALWISLLLCLVVGAPSALNNSIFDNQDFVWGLGLMLSGLFLTVLVWKVGPTRFYNEFFERDGKGNHFWFVGLMALVTVETVLLLGWWLWSESGKGGITWQCVIQWSVLIGVLIFLERFAKPEKFQAASD